MPDASPQPVYREFSDFYEISYMTISFREKKLSAI